MSKKVKTKRQTTAKTRGLIVLCVMLVLTVCLAVLGINGIAVLPPDLFLVTIICLSIFSFSSATWEIIPTRRFPSVSSASAR